ncbi:hypothetical protein OG894_44755 (plasmid) [Streptomyces sp. NBC_01724]|nr:hypothetical protein [Streptomyces sp. NBC_01724]
MGGIGKGSGAGRDGTVRVAHRERQRAEDVFLAAQLSPHLFSEREERPSMLLGVEFIEGEAMFAAE